MSAYKKPQDGDENSDIYISGEESDESIQVQGDSNLDRGHWILQVSNEYEDWAKEKLIPSILHAGMCVCVCVWVNLKRWVGCPMVQPSRQSVASASTVPRIVTVTFCRSPLQNVLVFGQAIDYCSSVRYVRPVLECYLTCMYSLLTLLIALGLSGLGD